MTTGPARRREAVAAAAAVALGAALGLTKLTSLDLPLMLANGGVILDTGSIPRTNVFSWVHADHPYLNDKWGFMVLVAAVERLAGVGGLCALKAALGAAMGAMLHGLARRRVAPWSAAGLAALGLTMLSYRLHLRAEWISYLFAAGTLAALPPVLEGRRGWMAACVAAMPVWAACHGYWILGPLLLAVAAAGSRSLPCLLTAAGSLAAAAVSPYGLANLAHPFHVLAQVGDEGLSQHITELRSPVSGPYTVFHALAFVLAAAGAGVALRDGFRRQWGRCAVTLLLVAVALRIDRNLALLGLVPPLAFGARAAWTGLAGPAAAMALATGVPWVAVGRQPGAGWADGVYPAEAIAAADAEPDGPQRRYVNDFSIGSFVVRARGVAFIDGNTEGYPASFHADYRRWLAGEIGIAQWDARFPADGYLLRHNLPTTRVVLLGLFLSDAYAPVHWDDVATVFRRDVPPEETERLWQTWLAEVYLPHAAAYFPASLQEPPTELGALRDAVARTPWDRRLYERLSEAYARTGDLAAAARCTRSALRLPMRGR